MSKLNQYIILWNHEIVNLIRSKLLGKGTGRETVVRSVSRPGSFAEVKG